MRKTIVPYHGPCWIVIAVQLQLLLILLTTSSGWAQKLQGDNNGKSCRLATFIPFTDIRPALPHVTDAEKDDDKEQNYYGYGVWPSAKVLGKASFSLLAAAELARRHFVCFFFLLCLVFCFYLVYRLCICCACFCDCFCFASFVPCPYIRHMSDLTVFFAVVVCVCVCLCQKNERDTSIVPELSDLLGNCDIVIPDSSFYLDSGYSRDQVVDSFLSRELDQVQNGTDPKTQVCAVIGPVETEAHEGLAPLTENFGIPQVAYQSIQHRFSRKDWFPTMVRVIPDGTDWGTTLANAIHRDLWLREYLAIIYEHDYGDQFESPLEDAEDDLDNFYTITEEVEEGNEESIRDALGEVIDEGYRTIMFIGNRFTLLHEIARVAEDMGLVGDGYFWILAGDAVPPKMLPTVRNKIGSPLDKLLDGAAVFTNYDPFVYNPRNDAFLSVWKEQDASFAEYLNFKLSEMQKTGETPFYYANPSYFQTEVPSEYASFMYDAIMSAGIGACRASESDEPSEHVHYQEILKTHFTGASGPVKFKSDDDGNFDNSRDMTDLLFGFHNLRPLPPDDNGMRG